MRRGLRLTLLIVALALGSFAPGARVARADGRTHVVAAGESLSELAARYSVSVERLRELNALSGDQIRVGQELRVDAENVLRYRTVPGDTLGCIAIRYEVPIERLLEDNPRATLQRLEAGLQLVIRGGVDPRAAEASEGEPTPHTVAEGDTFSALSEHYGVGLAELEALNPGVDPAHLAVGSTLQIPQEALRIHTVARGENVARIAAQYRVTVAALRRENPDLRPARLHHGQELRVPRTARRSESVGAPYCGFARGTAIVGEHPAYVLRNPARSWGTALTVERIRRGFDFMARTDPRGPRVRVHDLGLRGGGPIDDHRSHQSGRDVDITYYQREGCDTEEGCPLRRLDPADLDARRQWRLLREWLRRDEVDAAYVDYALQEPLYREARRRGATAEQLAAWFQYPRGRAHAEGRVRHFPNHRDHLHVRFACAPSERGCR